MDAYHIDRLKNVILYILREFPGGTDYIRLYKILYFANREQLARVGVPITADKFKAWKFGPVPSYTGSLVKRLEEKTPLDESQLAFKDALRVRKNKLVKALQVPDPESIPVVSREILDRYIRKYHDKDSMEISLESHDEAWEEAYHAHTLINPVLMAKCAGADPMMLSILAKSYGHDSEYFHLTTRSANAYASYEKALLTLDEIASLPEGWDGDDAFAVDPMAVVNARWILVMREAQIGRITSIFPVSTGTICIRWHHNGAQIGAQLSDTQLVFYYSSADGKEKYHSPVYEFGEEAMADLLTHLSLLRSQK